MEQYLNRVTKIEQCMSIKFYGKDKDGDSIFIDIEDKEAAEALFGFLLKAIKEDPHQFVKPDPTDLVV